MHGLLMHGLLMHGHRVHGLRVHGIPHTRARVGDDGASGPEGKEAATS